MAEPRPPTGTDFPGTLVLVVGPSGAGKDSLLAALQAELPPDAPVRFVTRLITRPRAAGGEDHEAVDGATFDALLETGGLALHWDAHGLRYGLPVILEQWLAAGDIVLANASRGIIDRARARYPRFKVLHVTASAAVLAARLAERGRESAEEVEARLARAGYSPPEGPDVATIVNDGALDRAVAQARAFLATLTR